MIFPRAADYPKCNRYLREEMPKVVRVPRIANAMRELGGLDSALFAQALRPGTPPTLTLFDRPMPQDSILGERWLIPRDSSGRIVLNVSLFEDFEAQSGNRLMGTAHVSARPGSPGAREFNGTFDRRGIVQTLGGGPPAPGGEQRSLGTIARNPCSGSAPACSAPWSTGDSGRGMAVRTRARQRVSPCMRTGRSASFEKRHDEAASDIRPCGTGSCALRLRSDFPYEPPSSARVCSHSIGGRAGRPLVVTDLQRSR